MRRLPASSGALLRPFAPTGHAFFRRSVARATSRYSPVSPASPSPGTGRCTRLDSCSRSPRAAQQTRSRPDRSPHSRLKWAPWVGILAPTRSPPRARAPFLVPLSPAGPSSQAIAIADFAAGSMQPAVVEFAGDTLEEDWSVTFGHEIMPARAIRSSSSELPVSSGPFRVEKHAVSAPRRAVAAPR